MAKVRRKPQELAKCLCDSVPISDSISMCPFRANSDSMRPRDLVRLVFGPAWSSFRILASPEHAVSIVLALQVLLGMELQVEVTGIMYLPMKHCGLVPFPCHSY